MTEIEPEILARARQGDRDAHAALYRAYAPMVFTLARRMLGSRVLAEDVLQDSFVEVIRKAAEFRGDAGVGYWIRQIAVNKCLSQLRSPWMQRWVRAPEHAPETDDAVDERSMEEAVLERFSARHAELEHALDALSATARAVVWLHAVEGYTHQEIGRLMGRSTSFSKSQLARACAQLRDMLEPTQTSEETEPCVGVMKTL